MEIAAILIYALLMIVARELFNRSERVRKSKEVKASQKSIERVLNYSKNYTPNAVQGIYGKMFMN